MSYNLSSFGKDLTDNQPAMGLVEVVRIVSEFVAKDIADWLRSEGVSVTDSLAESIAALPVEFDFTTATFSIAGAPYYKFINEGVDGVDIKHGSPYSFKTIKPPSFAGIDSIMNWLEAKVGGQVEMSHAYAVGVNIKKKGIKPKNLTQRILDSGISDRIEEAYMRAIEDNILNTIK